MRILLPILGGNFMKGERLLRLLTTEVDGYTLPGKEVKMKALFHSLVWALALVGLAVAAGGGWVW